MEFTGFCGPAYKSRSLAANAQRCVNYYLEPDPTGRGKFILYPTPGSEQVAVIGGGSLIAMETAGDSIIAVGDGNIYRIQSNYAWNVLDGVPTASDAYIAVAGDRALVVTGNTALGINLGDWTTFTPSLPFVPATCTVLNGYFIANEVDTQKWYYSAPFDPSSWNALDFFSKEAAPDDLVRVIADYRELFLIGSSTTEVWTTTGGQDVFDRVQGVVMEHGTIARASVAKMDGNIFMVGNNAQGQGTIWRISGYQPQIISTPAIGYELETYSRLDDAFGFCYQQGGHAFYQVTFPTAGKTWVYDISVGEWHERGSIDTTTGLMTQHIATCHTLFNNEHLIGYRGSGILARWDLTLGSDNGADISRIRSSPHVFSENKRLFVPRFEVFFDTGNSPLGVSNVAALRISRDGGRTFGNERTRSLGATGEYRTRCVWHQNGSMRDGVFEVTVTGNVFAPILGASFEVEQGMG